MQTPHGASLALDTVAHLRLPPDAPSRARWGCAPARTWCSRSTPLSPRCRVPSARPRVWTCTSCSLGMPGAHRVGAPRCRGAPLTEPDECLSHPALRDAGLPPLAPAGSRPRFIPVPAGAAPGRRCAGHAHRRRRDRLVHGPRLRHRARRRRRSGPSRFAVGPRGSRRSAVGCPEEQFELSRPFIDRGCLPSPGVLVPTGSSRLSAALRYYAAL